MQAAPTFQAGEHDARELEVAMYAAFVLLHFEDEVGGRGTWLEQVRRSRAGFSKVITGPPGSLDHPTTRQMRLAAIPKLLPPPQMARGMPDAYSCEVRRLLMAQKMLRGDRILVIFFWSRATAGRDKKRARHTLRLTTRLLLRSSPVPQVNGPCKAFAPAAAGRNPPTFAPFAGRKVKIPNFLSALLD